MSDVVFVLRNPESEPPAKGATGSTPLEQAWLDALIRIVVDGLSVDELWFMVAILWAPELGKPRTHDDACSKLQRLGLVKPTKARSVCVPTRLTPLGHSVRQALIDKARSKHP